MVQKRQEIKEVIRKKASRKFIFWIVIAFSLIFDMQPVSAEQFLVPPFVNWSLTGAYSRSNNLRSEIILNGWWRWQAAGKEKSPPSGGWFYRQVPSAGWELEGFPVKDKDNRLAKKEKGKEITGLEKCWQEREFVLPADWQRKDVYVEIKAIRGKGAVFLDGKRLGFLWPNVPYSFPLPKPYKENSPYRLSILSGGIINNVWLKAYPDTGFRITDSYLTTSVRKMAAHLAIEGTGSSGVKVEVLISEGPDLKKVVKKAGPFSVEQDGQGWKGSFSFPWKDAELWSPENPHLYYYSLQLVDKKAQVLDRTLPVRFGFREFWIKGGNFIFNGKPIRLRSDANVPFTFAISPWDNRMGVLGDGEYIRNLIRAWKKLGLNSCLLYASPGAALDAHLLFKIADEEGFFIESVIPYLNKSSHLNGIRWRDYLKKYERHLSSFIKAYRQSPSLLFYMYLPGSVVWDYFPSKLGRPYDPDKIWGKGRNYGQKAMVERADPVRFLVAYSRGGIDEPVAAAMKEVRCTSTLQNS